MIFKKRCQCRSALAGAIAITCALCGGVVVVGVEHHKPSSVQVTAVEREPAEQFHTPEREVVRLNPFDEAAIAVTGTGASFVPPPLRRRGGYPVSWRRGRVFSPPWT